MASLHAQVHEMIKAFQKKIDEKKAAQEAQEPNNQTLITDFWPIIDYALLNNQTLNR
jgi:hypothetical protein